jgi:hypothetical protein
MALLTSAPISQLAVQLLSRSLVLPATVARVPMGEYAGPSGGTVTVRVPETRTANVQATPGASITYATVNETPVNVTVAHLYDATLVTDEDLSLELEDFGRQIMVPQVDAVARAAEDQLATVMNAVTPDASFAAVADPDDTEAKILAAREFLTNAQVPLGDRFMAVAPDIATRVLSVPKFVQVADRGDASALTDATIGRLYGFTFVETPALTPGTAVAYHRSGFAWANAAPADPGANTDSTSVSHDGVNLRHLLAFDPSRLSTASTVSVFAGAAPVEDVRTYKLDTATP